MPYIVKYFFLIVLFVSIPFSLIEAKQYVEDDLGNKFLLDKPARRIISLAPHITEMLYSAGAGQYVVGTVQHTDYPESAKKIRKIGSYNNFSLETIISLKPDLIVAWQSGNPHHIVEKLKTLGFSVFINQPDRLLDIPSVVKRLSLLTQTNSEKNVNKFLLKYKQLKKKYSNKHKVKLFYQYWNQPIMTINGEHIITDVMRLCGAENIFHDVKALAPAVTVESVIKSNVDVIMIGGLKNQHRQWLDDWRKWKDLPAVKNNNLYNVNPDLLQRHTLRMIDGAEVMCQKVDLARQN